MDNVRNFILARIKEVSEHYQYHGFWKCGAAYVNGIDREDNPYLYFPSEEYCYNALMKEYNNLTDDDFTARLIDGCISFEDGDKLNIPFELFKQKPEIRIDVEYNRDDLMVYYTSIIRWKKLNIRYISVFLARYSEELQRNIYLKNSFAYDTRRKKKLDMQSYM